MKADSKATRRSFIRRAGAVLSSPVAIAAAAPPHTVAAAEVGTDTTRLARLEDLNAIRALNHEHAAQANARAWDFGRQDVIDIAPDRMTATATLHCIVEHEIAIGPECPTVEMARQQGSGVIRHDERGIFDNSYVRRDGTWTLERSNFRSL